MLRDGTATSMWFKCLGRLFGAPVCPSSVLYFLSRWGHILFNWYASHNTWACAARDLEGGPDWTLQHFTRSQRLPFNMEINKTESSSVFFCHTLLSKVNRSLKRCEASGSIRTRPHQKYEVTPLKWVISLLVFLAGREPTYIEHILILRILHTQFT